MNTSSALWVSRAGSVARLKSGQAVVAWLDNVRMACDQAARRQARMRCDGESDEE